MKKIIFRMDDVGPDMNYEKFAIVRDIFFEEGIKPLMGVVPSNKEESFKLARKESVQLQDNQIWDEIKELQDKHGWEIALHGYEHVYKTNDGGILHINRKSEFAGVAYDEQKNRIEAGKKLLEDKGLKCIAFMAPAHSFDDMTVKALHNAGIDAITDGRGVYPYKYKGAIMMPVPYSIYRKLPVGIYTVCLHANTLDSIDYVRLKTFIKKEKDSIISFSEGLRIFESRKDRTIKVWNVINGFLESFMTFGIFIARLLGKARRKVS